MSGGADVPRDEDGLRDYDSKRVIDDEGDVDAQVKARILNSREAINENENVLFTHRTVRPDIEITHAQATVAWGHSVKRYIRDVEILLTNDDIPEAKKYYLGVDLGDVTLVPPETEGYDFSKFANDDLDDMRLKKEMGLPPNCEVPEPYTETFTGLKSLLEAGEVVRQEWTVFVDKTGPRASWEPVTIDAMQPIPKHIYERAVRHTDQFLQEAGIGVHTGMPEEDDEAEAW